MQTSKKKERTQGWKAELNAPLPFPFSQKNVMFSMGRHCA
jgi:hypothetical protein